jgi:NADH-quinone oxidoreductase subunit J
MFLEITVLVGMAFMALWAVMTRSLLRSAIALALTSVVLAIIMFQLDSPLAAVFELSVCAGLISVLFVSTISLTHPLTWSEIRAHMKERFSRFWYLPALVVIAGIWLVMLHLKFDLVLPPPESVKDVRRVLWEMRQVDVMGQIIILLSGVFGVLVLFKDRMKR